MSVTTFLGYFPPNPRKHGLMTGLAPNGQKVIRTVQPGPVTPELLSAHLEGTGNFRALGYLPALDGGTNVGVLDLDAKDYPDPGSLEDARLRLRDVAEARGWHVYFEASTRHGWHAYVFTDGALPYPTMRAALTGWAREAGLERFETYPKGDDAPGPWFLMPYARAASDPKRLGATFLTTADGQPVPYDELGEWLERTPARLLQEAATEFQEAQGTPETTEPVDLAPAALEGLKEAASRPPATFPRHDCLIAFINLARRCGQETAMLEHLKSESVRAAWVGDGSRDARAWAGEVDRWAKAKRGGREYGLPFLKSQGFKVPDLPRVRRGRTPKNPPKDGAEERAGPYLVSGGAICHEKQSRDGTVTVPLCNFAARIVEERLRDDGAEQALTLVLAGKLANGTPLPPAEVGASQFASMNWPVSEWGARAVVNAGQGAKDHLRAAIQTLSGDVPRRTTYTHVGWREVDGAHVYLHANGAIGAPGAPIVPGNVNVDLSDTLTRYALPEPPTGADLRRAVLASLGVLDCAPDAVSVPLLGAAYRAPLGGVDFGLHLVGATGAGKSELAALAQQHYGAGLDARHLPGSWSSTANALEGLAFSTKDALMVADDFAPEGSAYDIARYHATAARLLRAQGNNSARGRMRADGTLRPDKPPRGFILSTGEDTPKGHNVKARTLILELEPGALHWGRVTEAQEEAAAGGYASAMSAYLQWLATDYPARTAAFRAAHHRLRAELHTGGHRRTVDAGAQLLATWETFISFSRDTGTLTAEEGARLWERVYRGILDTLEPQAALQAQSDPVIRFHELLTGLFVSGRAHVVDAATGDYPGDGWGWEATTHRDQYGEERRHRPKGDRIGWADGTGLYLEPSATYRAISLFARDQGEGVPVTERVLWKRLAERGHLLSTDDGKHTVKKTLPDSGRVRVLHLAPLPPVKMGAIGAMGADAVQDATDRAPIPEIKKSEKGHSEKTGAPAEARAPIAPEGETPESGMGARETASGTGRAPGAPIAPENTGVEGGFAEERDAPEEVRL